MALNSDTAIFQMSNARPWYLSLTARWVDDPNGLLKLLDVLAPYNAFFPLHHVRVPERSLHSTVFAILEINGKPKDFDSASDYATNLFKRLHENTGLVKKIKRKFQSLKVTTNELKCFDDGTAVQFEDNDQLRQFRDSVRPFFELPVEALIEDSVNSPHLRCLLCDPKKSCGAKFFGSVARSPSKCDTKFLRWEKSLPGTTLTFRSVHLLVSDDALTNPLCPGKNDIFIDAVDEKN